MSPFEALAGEPFPPQGFDRRYFLDRPAGRLPGDRGEADDREQFTSSATSTS
jgi:hypothetical protein